MKRINLGLGISNPQKKRGLRKVIKKLFPILILVGIFISLAIFITTFSSGPSVFNYIFSGTSLNSSAGKVNVLFLGIAGGTHDGANLTDTMLVASYNLQTSQLYLISVPRDLWMPSLKSKANAIYEIGLAQNNGLGLTKTVIGNVLGIPIQYGLRIDFRGFVQAVDNLGGIDLTVDRSFDDYNYPIEGKENDLCGYQEKEIDVSEDQAKQLNIGPGKIKVFVSSDGQIATDSAQEDKGAKYFTCRYEHISFTEGPTHMDGITALKFVRSRHGTNGEGSDFARSARQEKVVQAIRTKVLSFETLSNPSKISEIINTLGKNIDTDVSVRDALEFYKLSKRLEQTHAFTIDTSQVAGLPAGRTSLLINPPASDYGGAYVLISQDDDFSTIQEYVKKILSGEITNEQSSFPRKDEAATSARSGNR